MKKETDLDGVKSVAITLLLTDYHKTEMSPVIIQHPFTNSGITQIKRNGTKHIGKGLARQRHRFSRPNADRNGNGQAVPNDRSMQITKTRTYNGYKKDVSQKKPDLSGFFDA